MLTLALAILIVLGVVAAMLDIQRLRRRRDRKLAEARTAMIAEADQISNLAATLHDLNESLASKLETLPSDKPGDNGSGSEEESFGMTAATLWACLGTRHARVHGHQLWRLLNFEPNPRVAACQFLATSEGRRMRNVDDKASLPGHMIWYESFEHQSWDDELSLLAELVD